MTEAAISYEDKPLPEGQLLRLNDWEEPGAWTLAGILALFGILIAVPVHGRGLGHALAGFALIVAGLMVASVARSGLIVDREGITVRDLLRSRRWAWDDVDRFEVRLPLLRGALRVHLVNGEVISTPGLDGRSASERRLSSAWLAELNHRAGGAAE
jgi:Bacterial PH domain